MSVSQIGVVSIGSITAGGVGIYKWTSISTEDQKNQTERKSHKHKEIFNKLKKDYLFRTFAGSDRRTVSVEMIDPNDPWWNTKWEEYKKKNTTLPETRREDASRSLEDFQSVCFEEIQRRGPNFSDTAKYAEMSGKLRNVKNSDSLGSDEMRERKFSWEYCMKVTVTQS